MDSKSIYEQIKLFKLQSDDLDQCMELDQIALNRIWTMDQWKWYGAEWLARQGK